MAVITIETPASITDHLEALKRDLKQASATLSEQEARYLVDLYYSMQEYRISTTNQVRTMGEEPHDTIAFFARQMDTLERQVKSVLDTWSAASELGQWARRQKGIGPVIAAGLLAHIDIRKAPTVGHIWRFAGLDPTIRWEKGQKRPWNASLKVLCWKIGESFVKVSGDDEATYGRLYRERKAYEMDRNLTGALAEQATKVLTERRIGKDTEAFKHYSEGKLPPAHIHARAKRYAVKQFLSDYHAMAYRIILGEEPPFPYPIAHLNHAHLRQVPA